MVRTRVNGLSIFDYFDEDTRETGRAQIDEPRYKEAVSNGYDPFDFALNGLILYLPLWALKESTFKSVDAYKESITVTGALWQPDGRLFDGTDDRIDLPASWMPETGTIIMWVKYAAANQGYLLSSDGNELSLFNVAGGTFQFYYNGGAARIGFADDWADDILVNLAITYIKGGACEVFANGVSKDTGTCENVTPTNVATRLGEGTAGDQDFTGTIGEVRVYNRVLTDGEVLHDYNTTKWRYQ